MVHERRERAKETSSPGLGWDCIGQLSAILKCIVRRSIWCNVIFLVWFSTALFDEYAAQWWGLIPSWYLTALGNQKNAETFEEIEQVTYFAVGMLLCAGLVCFRTLRTPGNVRVRSDLIF